MYACSPAWPGDWINETDLQACIQQLSGRLAPSPWGPDHVSLNHGLHFTGGEPFLNYPLLLRAVELSEAAAIPSTFVETNAFWCRTDEKTRDKLAELRSAGLKGILISINPYYAEFVPFERSERAVRISLEIFGDNVLVYQMSYYKMFRRLGFRGLISPDEWKAATGRHDLAGVELFLMGRAARQLRDLYPAYAAERFSRKPCRPPFLRTWHNHLDNYGNIMPGYCGGISLGSWRDLGQLIHTGIDLETRPVLGYLVRGDMAGLLDYACKRGFQCTGRGYVSKCHLCLELRAFLARNGSYPELAPRIFYDILELEDA